MGLSAIIAIIAAIGIGAGILKAYTTGDSNGFNRANAAMAAADAKVVSIGAQLEQEGATHVAKEAQAFELGKKQGHAVFIKAAEKGASDVSTFKVFQNPVCVIPPESLANLLAARAGAGITDDDGLRPSPVGTGPGLQTTRDPAGVIAPVRESPTTKDGRPSKPVPTGHTGHRPLGALH